MRFRFPDFPSFATSKGFDVFHQPARFQKEKSNSCQAPNYVRRGLTVRSTRTLPLRVTALDNRFANVSLSNALLRQRPVNSDR